jgi:hypothetical protein
VPALAIEVEAVAALVASGVLTIASVSFSKIAVAAEGKFTSDNNLLAKATISSKQSIKSIDRNFLKGKYEKHIFPETKPNTDTLTLGNSKNSIMNEALDKIEFLNNQNLLREGPIQIITTMNGHEAVVRALVVDGNVISFNVFRGTTKRWLGSSYYL